MPVLHSKSPLCITSILEPLHHTCQRPSIKYVTLFLANFYPLPSVTLRHTSREPPKVRHTSRIPPIFRRPSTKNPDKSPLYKFCLNCSRGFCPGILSGVFCLEGFVWGGFCPFPFLSEYICYIRKLKVKFHVSYV